MMSPCECSGAGFVLRSDRGYDTVFRCPCPAGERYAAMFFPSDRKKERPVEMSPELARELKPKRQSGRDRAAGD